MSAWIRAIALTACLGALAFVPSSASAAGSGGFGPTGSMTIPREQAATAPLPDGRVLLAGGDNHTDSDIDTAEIYDPQTGSFSSAGLGTLTTPRSAAGAALLPDGRVLIVGGFNGSTRLDTAEIFNPQTGTFSSAGIGTMSTGRGNPVAVTLQDGRVLVAGGCSGGACTPQASAEVFNPQTNSFSTAGIGSMGTPRTAAAGARLPDGRVVIAGGYNGDELATAEIFDPQTNTFSSAGVGSLGQKRSDLTAEPLPDGRVLFTGGFADSEALASSEVFDPQTNTFSTAGIGSLAVARGDQSGAPLPDGRVLIAGGFGNGDGPDFLQSAEVYSATNTFTYALSGRTLTVSVEATGQVSVGDAATPLSASTAKKKKKKKGPLLSPSSASGDPPTISVPLVLTKSAKQKLKAKGKVTVQARITFTPQGGVATTQTAALKLTGKKKKKKKK
jgi:hypothetical protein